MMTLAQLFLVLCTFIFGCAAVDDYQGSGGCIYIQDEYGICRTGGCLADEKPCTDSEHLCPGEECQCCIPQIVIECRNEGSPCGKRRDGVCRIGGCRPNEKVCEYSKKYCPGDDCQCCISPKECRIESSTCADNGDGVCRTGGCRSNERVCKYSKKYCPGDDCQCCRPPKGCPKEATTCGENGDGVCRISAGFMSCRVNEKVDRYSKSYCPGEDCECCTPIWPGPTLIKECRMGASTCGERGDGVCRAGGCRSNEKACEYSKKNCPGDDCQCCKPRKECRIELSTCGDNGDGVCRTGGCRPNERVCENSKKYCPGDDCQCCRPPKGCPKEATSCGERGDGVCRISAGFMFCRANEEVDRYSKSYCPGEDCRCCTPIRPRKSFYLPWGN